MKFAYYDRLLYKGEQGEPWELAGSVSIYKAFNHRVEKEGFEKAAHRSEEDLRETARDYDGIVLHIGDPKSIEVLKALGKPALVFCGDRSVLNPARDRAKNSNLVRVIHTCDLARISGEGTMISEFEVFIRECKNRRTPPNRNP